MFKCSRLTRPVIGALVAIAVSGGGSAHAAAPAPYKIYGSDTLFDIMTQAITNARTQGVVGADQLIYAGTGSGNGENEMKNNAQSIAPMSRNFRPATVTSFPAWAPTVQNIVGLDAAVIVTKNTIKRCKNMTLPPLATDTTKATPNVAGTPINFGTKGSGYTQMLEVILSGIDGSGSTAACSDPRRVQAIQDFASCNGVTTIDHFYRRDDNSGTTDTFKDKLAVSRFCNGAAQGSVVAGYCSNNGNKTCAFDADCGTGNTCIAEPNNNLHNQDLDPIRRPCADPGLRGGTTCTDLTTGFRCKASDANPNCTQGLVVALSDGDFGSSDITVTIADRVGGDSSGQTFGYGGREAVKRPGAPTAGVYVNNIAFSDANVRLDQYMLSRRLFLQRGTGNDDNGTVSNTLHPQGGGGTSQATAEANLYNFMTDPSGVNNPGNTPGRCNVDPLVKQFGFITCTTSCTQTPSGASNLCSKSPYPTVPSTASACIPTAGTWGFAAVSCSAGQICCSTGLACPGNGQCPAANGRGANAACAAPTDCTSGVCSDAGFGIKLCQ
jgi:hypothetical protein